MALSINLHLLVAMALAAGAEVAAGAGASLELLHFEDLLRLWGAFGFRVVDFVKPSLVVKDLRHLLF